MIMLNGWLKDNLWNMIITAVAIIVAFVTLNARVVAIEQDHESLQKQMIKLEDVIIHLTQINERQMQIRADIQDIKAQLKEINGKI